MIPIIDMCSGTGQLAAAAAHAIVAPQAHLMLHRGLAATASARQEAASVPRRRLQRAPLPGHPGYK